MEPHPHHYAALFDTGDGRLGEMVYCTDPTGYDGASQGVNTSHGCPLAGESQLYVKYNFADFTESKEQAEGHTTVTYRGATGLFLVGDIYRLDPGFKGKFQVDYTARDSKSGKPDVPVIKTTVKWPLEKVAPIAGAAASTSANPAETP